MAQTPALSGASSAVEPAVAPLDPIIAYAFGEASPADRILIEEALRTGDPAVTKAFNEISASLSELPAVLPAVQPPLSTRERVLSNLHVSAPVAASSAGRRAAKWGASLALLLLLGGGGYYLASPQEETAALSVTASAGEATALVATTDVSPSQEAVKEAFVEAAPQTTTRPTDATEPLDLEETLTYKHEDRETAIPGRPINYPAALPPGKYNYMSQSNFATFEAHAKLQNDPEANRYIFLPISARERGDASLLWSTMTGSVVFQAENLKPTEDSANYVLYYIKEDGTADRMISFKVASAAAMSFIPPRIPYRTIQRVVLTYEKMVTDADGPRLIREEILIADRKEKVLIVEPLARSASAR
jgi:hypothetical protein